MSPARDASSDEPKKPGWKGRAFLPAISTAVPFPIVAVIAVMVVIVAAVETLRRKERQVGVVERNTKNWFGLSPSPTGGTIGYGL